MKIAVLDVPKNLSIGSKVGEHKAYSKKHWDGDFGDFCQNKILNSSSKIIKSSFLLVVNYLEGSDEGEAHVNGKEDVDSGAGAQTTSHYGKKQSMVTVDIITRDKISRNILKCR